MFHVRYYRTVCQGDATGTEVRKKGINRRQFLLTYQEVQMKKQTILSLAFALLVTTAVLAGDTPTSYVISVSSGANADEFLDMDNKVIHVDGAAVGTNDGFSWGNAFIHLQDALAIASDGDEIRVAQGVYRPDRSTAYPAGTGSREASFHLVNGVALMGGYAGWGSPDPNERDIERYAAILSGDLLGNDAYNDVDGYSGWPEDDPNLTDNCYHVVTSNGTDDQTVVDGFFITGGYAFVDWEDLGPESSGAGLHNIEGHLSVMNCTFRNNIALGRGSAIYNQDANPRIINCTFETNDDCGSPEMAHGALDNVGSRSIISNCRFYNNGVYGVSNDGGNSVVDRCVFEENDGIWIGAIDNFNTNVEITECSFLYNSGRWTGAMPNWNSSVRIQNCVFAGNYSDEAYWGDGGTIVEYGSHSLITNCTFYGNCGLLHRVDNSGESVVSNCIFYKNFQGEDRHNVDGPAGPYNYNGDPFFVNALELPGNTNLPADYHVKSEFGRWDPNSQSWVYDTVTSPCIDGGNPADPNWMKELWPHGKRINMGAYGGTPEAGKSSSTLGNSADLTHDDCVGMDDFILFVDQWLTSQVLCPEDINLDGQIDLADFSIFADNWSFCSSGK